jgi:WD40 repeat protein
MKRLMLALVLVAGCRRPEAVIPDPEPEAEAPTFKGHVTGVTALAFSPDGARLLSASPDAVKVWSLTKAAPLLEFRDDAGTPTEAALGERIVIAYQPPPLPGAASRVVVRDGKGELSRTVRGKGGRFWALSSSGDKAFSRGDEDTLWDTTTGRELATFRIETKDGLPEAAARRLALAPDGGRVAMMFTESSLNVFDARAGRIAVSLEKAGLPRAVRFDPEGRWVAAIEEGVRVWDAKDGRLLYEKDIDDAVSLAFGGGRLAVGTGREADDKTSAKGAAVVLDAATGQDVRRVGAKGWAGAVALSHDGKRLAVGTGREQEDRGGVEVFEVP